MQNNRFFILLGFLLQLALYNFVEILSVLVTVGQNLLNKQPREICLHYLLKVFTRKIVKSKNYERAYMMVYLLRHCILSNDCISVLHLVPSS